MQLRATRQKIESNDSHVTRTLDDVALMLLLLMQQRQLLLLLLLLLLLHFYQTPQQFPIKAAATTLSRNRSCFCVACAIIRQLLDASSIHIHIHIHSHIYCQVFFFISHLM